MARLALALMACAGTAGAEPLPLVFPAPLGGPPACVVATGEYLPVAIDARVGGGLARIDMLVADGGSDRAWQVSPFGVPGDFHLEGFAGGSAIIWDTPLPARRAAFATDIADGPEAGRGPHLYAFRAIAADGTTVAGPLVAIVRDAGAC